jgi:HSP20 family molecular chaperone IbpA
MERPEIRPSVGFCIQTDSLGKPAGRYYLNMCRHKLVEMPQAYSGKVISREFILTHGIGSMKVPFDMGSFRKLKERAEGAKQTAYCVDVIFNPFIIQLFMDDAFNNTMKEFRPFVINLALGRVESSIGVKLSSEKIKLVKKFLYKDGEGPDGDIPREFMELPQDIDAEEELHPQKAAPTPQAEEPLIQDMTPGPRKPVVKKGFLNSNSKSLYPEGSNEGVLPENAGDPMGWMPKKLRNTSRIIDCNSPEYQASEKANKEAAAHNKRTKEFNDMLGADLEKWGKAYDNKWSADLPDGTEPSPAAKYEVDYSRFDRIEDVEDKPAIPERDWYCDEKGVCRSRDTSTNISKPPATTEAEPAVKKGFLDNAKTPLYPKGSEQRAPPSDADMFQDKDLMKSLGDMMVEEGIDTDALKNFNQLLRNENPQEAQASKPSVLAKSSKLKAPEFNLDRVEDQLHLVVEVPGLQSMQDVDLDVTDRKASLTFPDDAGLRPLKVELPEAVVPTGVRAKFSKKTHQLTVKLPLAAP